ncbi:MAG: tetratricopeptide repeat protein [Acidobacteria bacterium]|nr:tetratricopeptide repeat protein [Acidobacteriota bacterium]
MLARGEYREAIQQLEATLAKSPGDWESAMLLWRARMQVGDYAQVLEEGEESLKQRSDPAISAIAAEAAVELGKYDRAVTLLEGLSIIQAEWLRGMLAQRKGLKEVARAAWERILTRSGASSLVPEEKGLAAAALAELGRFKEANEVYRDAVATYSENASLRVNWGLLFLQKHNPADAEGLFREALELNTNHTGALLGMAELAAGRWESQAPGTLNRALQINPNLLKARVMLAKIELEHDNYAAAAAELEKALRVNPLSLEAWSLRAVSEYLRGNTEAEREWIARTLRENPSYGQVFADLGNFALLRRQYGAAVEYFRRAVETDPALSQAQSSLGINLLRLGKEEEARQALEKAYRDDPYNIWTINTLRLMDSFKRYDSFETARFRVKLHQKESAVLRPYVEELLEKSLQEMSQRYQYSPSVKVVFEMYPDHEDFAVRTLGLPGLGALGASFGPVVAMDSPAARRRGEFHWGSTLWHELGHVITLGLTDNRVPRWFTEGLSVYEENHARPGWGDSMSPGIVQGLQLF